MKIIKILVPCFLLSVLQSTAQKTLNRKVGPQDDDDNKSVLVPVNQLITPAGTQISFPGRPGGLALVRDGKYLLVRNINSLELIRLADSSIVQSLRYTDGGSSFNGFCVSKDAGRIYVSQSNDHIFVGGMDDNNIIKWRKPIMLPQPAIGDAPVPGGLALSKDEKQLYVAISRSNTLGVINSNDSLIEQIPVGMVPFGVLVVSPSKAYVTNWGGRKPKQGEVTYNSSGTQVLVNPENGVASSGSVSVVDLINGKEIKEIEVGLHPSSMALSPDGSRLYVACANSDVVSVINTSTDVLIDEISVHKNKNTLFGSAPCDLTLSPDGKLLYVADGTQNAICVIDVQSKNVLGYIPVGWYPGSILTDKSGHTLYVANIKGTGSRDKKPNKRGYSTHDFLGSISIVKTPSASELKSMTATVEKNNLLTRGMQNMPDSTDRLKVVPVPHVAGQTSTFKHVVYIIKENRVYDQVLGDMKQGNGDTSLVLFGKNVTPNHHKLAESFVLLDNFYTSGVLSADGHQWTDEAYATDYLERSFGGFDRSYPYDGDDAMAYASTGFLWNNALKHGLTFRDYGEFVQAVIQPDNLTFSQYFNDLKTGANKIKIQAKANLEQLKPYLCPTYIGFPNEVPDAYRVQEFLKEFHQFEQNDSFPNFTIMLLPCDHTSGTTPGTPTTRAALADNDLALGQIVEAISNSKFWKETCIFVTEDDSQDGADHVDGHRTVGFVISPYTKRNTVVSTYYSQVTMVRTIENILGLPPMNQLDASSGDMSDCFTTTPDFTPYKAEQNNIPLDEINPPVHALAGKQRYWAIKSLSQNLDNYDEVDEDIFNRIIWHSVKGYDIPYPELGK